MAAVTFTGMLVYFREKRADFLYDLSFETVFDLRTGKEAFGFQAVGQDYLVAVEEDMDVFDHAAFHAADGAVVYEIFGGDEHFGIYEEQLGQWVFDEDAVQRRNQHFAVVAEGVRRDADRGVIPDGGHDAATEPAERLGAVVFGDDEITGLEFLDWDFSGGRQDHGAGHETGHLVERHEGGVGKAVSAAIGDCVGEVYTVGVTTGVDAGGKALAAIGGADNGHA